MVYIKDKGKYKTLKELAAEYKTPLELIKGRFTHGIRDVDKLVEPKWARWKND
jgi:hypothetical protein